MVEKKGGLDRRRFVKASTGLAASIAAGGGSRAKAARPCPADTPVFKLNRRAPALADLTGGKQPNILLVITDQERYAGNLPPSLNRPCFDRLRGSAVNFSNTFSADPVCSPSRSAIFSGCFPHQTGVTQNMIFPVARKPLDKVKPHLGSVLASAGYRIGYKGKWDLSKGPTFYTANVRDRGRAGHYGFEGHCGDVPDQEYGYIGDDRTVREACDWIRMQNKGRPWFLCCSIINPHDICHPQLKPDDSIRADVRLPESLSDDLSGKPADQKRLRELWIAEANRLLHPGAKSFTDYEETDWKKFLSFYYDLIELTDEYIGRLFKALEDSDTLDDTVIIYTSDHGELGGAHGFIGKHQCYEEDLHIPLYVSHPRIAAREVSELACNTDIAPTIAALAGADWPASIPGRDASGWITGRRAGKRDAVFSETETYINLGVWKMYFTTRMIRTDRWKYSYYFSDRPDGQLYDLESDPIEMNNLFRDPACSGIRRELEDRLRAWQKETGDDFMVPK